MLLDPSSPLQCLLICLLFAPREVLSNDGFMQDFFSRFPNLPFGNMKSFKFLHDRASLPESNTLLTKSDDFSSFGFHNIKKRKNEFLPKSQDQTVTVSVKEVHSSTTTKSTISKGKQRILFSKRKSTKSYSKKTTVRPSIRLTTKPHLKGSTVDRLKYYNDFKIVSTTAVYGENQLAKYGSPKPSFYFYQDNFSSRRHIYHDDFFATQMDKPKQLADQQFYAYDPFLQSELSTDKPE